VRWLLLKLLTLMKMMMKHRDSVYYCIIYGCETEFLSSNSVLRVFIIIWDFGIY